LVQDARLTSPSGDGMNGIVWHPGGYLLAVNYGSGALLRIPLRDPANIQQVQLDQPLVGGDGLALRLDGTLVVVSNALGQRPEGTVTVLSPRGVWSSARVRHHVDPWPDAVPSTVAVTPSGSYVASGRLDVLITGATADQFTLRRI
ncbi:MAG: hypothetical protein LC635_03250, partial [Pseudonocardiaceae bacterium]|nr:hypothetical protein [Pseudonocardiaceae bacterium]